MHNLQRGPLYLQIYNELHQLIINGTYQEGDYFPTEKMLMEKYKVSRITIRNAMELLQNEGLIEKASGLGTIVKSNKQVIELSKRYGFTSDNYKNIVSSKLLSFELIKPNVNIQKIFNLTEEGQVYKLERLRFMSGLLVGIHIAYIPTNLIALSENDFSSNKASLYETFKDNGIYVDNAVETFEAVNADENLSKLLKIKNGSAVVYIERITYDTKHNPVEYVEMYYKSDHYKYQVEIKQLDK